jgi:hypothetical protein
MAPHRTPHGKFRGVSGLNRPWGNHAVPIYSHSRELGRYPATTRSDPTMSRRQSGEPPTPLLSTRTALVLLLALITGAATTTLTLLAGRHPAEAVLAGLAATGAAVTCFHNLIA